VIFPTCGRERSYTTAGRWWDWRERPYTTAGRCDEVRDGLCSLVNGLTLQSTESCKTGRKRCAECLSSQDCSFNEVITSEIQKFRNSEIQKFRNS